MIRPSLLLLILLLVGGLSALRQGQDEEILRDLPTISSVILDSSESGLIIAIKGRYAKDCFGRPRSQVRDFPHNIDIEAYRERSSLAACELQASPFVFRIALETSADPAYIVINDQVWARPSDDFEEELRYEIQSLFPVHIDQAAVSAANGETGHFQLSLRGSQSVGCDLPEIFTLRQTDERVLIGVYNAMEAEAVCPDLLVEVDASLNLAATELPADTLIAVNTILIEEMETQNVSDSDKVLTNISSALVDLEETPQRIFLVMKGEHPDGCDLPVQVEQSRAGNTINVEVYRQVPADMICPMILRPYQGAIELDGEFAAGNYTVSVNSVLVSFDI